MRRARRRDADAAEDARGLGAPPRVAEAELADLVGAPAVELAAVVEGEREAVARAHPHQPPRREAATSCGSADGPARASAPTPSAPASPAPHA